VTDNAVISDVDALMYVVLKIEKVPYGELVMAECIMLQMICHTHQGPHNQVQVYTCVCVFLYAVNIY